MPGWTLLSRQMLKGIMKGGGDAPEPASDALPTLSSSVSKLTPVIRRRYCQARRGRPSALSSRMRAPTRPRPVAPPTAAEATRVPRAVAGEYRPCRGEVPLNKATLI